MANGRKAGVLTLIRKNSGLTVVSSEQDTEGRRASIVVNNGHTTYRLTNIYSPNLPMNPYFQELSSWLVFQAQHNHYIGGDFQFHCEAQRGKVQIYGFTGLRFCRFSLFSLHTFATSMQLLDLWRQSHLTDKEYTHYSHVHDRFSRIDYIFGMLNTRLTWQRKGTSRTTCFGIGNITLISILYIATTRPYFGKRAKHSSLLISNTPKKKNQNNSSWPVTNYVRLNTYNKPPGVSSHRQHGTRHT